MASLALKSKLGKLIKSGLQAAGLRQLDLAAHLHVSTSAVSQMLNGKTAPATVHLDKIFELLNCGRNQVFIMRDLLARIRSGMHELRSPVNEFLRSSRKECGLSMAKLAELSKISVPELRILETCSTVAPSNEQLKSLVGILKFEAGDIQKLISDLPLYGSDGVQEQVGTYGNNSTLSAQIPVLSIEKMLNFNPALEDIKNFVWRNYDKVISVHNLDESINDEDVFAIADSGDSFFPPLPGSINLIVALKKFPETSDTVIVKTKKCDKLRLKRFVLDGEIVSLKPFIGSVEQHVDKIEWVRKVLKVTISEL